MQFNPDVYFTGRSFSEDEIKGKCVVVIDVLRACSSIVTALNNGARGVIAVENMADASRIAQNLDPTAYLLCGEKDGEKIEGFHLGNSPLEYTADVVQNKTLLLNTTNGSRAIHRCANAERVIIGSFLNIAAVVRELKQCKTEKVIVCSGWKNRLSFEDLLCAGNILHDLNDGELADTAPDGAQVAFTLYNRFGKNISKAVKGSNHAERLRFLGFDQDIAYCSQKDIFDTVPKLVEGIIK